MIHVVDDEKAFRDAAEYILSSEGYVVVTFDNAQSALEAASPHEPELVISDIMMPGMSGFEFKEAYGSIFPNRRTPFVFLSSLSDDDNIVKGLDLGAGDYLTKPVNSSLLKAKVRSVLGRKERYARPMFQGDLSKLPFVKLLQFCELRGLTGRVALSSPGGVVDLPLKRGELVPDNLDETLLDQFYDQAEGTFTVYVEPVDFSSIAESAPVEPRKAQTPVADRDRPMGKLSGVQVNNRLFQVQTEFVTHPEARVLTIVILDGKVVIKKAVPVAEDKIEKKNLELLIESQHASVELEVREKISELARSRSGDKASPQDRFKLLFEQGFDEYREARFERALELWEEARAINPEDKILNTNLGMLRRKLKLDS